MLPLALAVVLDLLLELAEGASADVVVVWMLLVAADTLAVVLLRLLLEVAESISAGLGVVCSLLLVACALAVVLG